VRLCKEDEGVSICAALSYCGRRSVLLMQQTGLYDSINAIRAIAVDYGHPICMIVGLQGAEAHIHPRESPKHIVRVAMPVLDALGVEYHLLVADGDEAKIPPAIDTAYETSSPVVFLIGARLPEE
jgi:sulfopyruvate decarboxylase subunit beta